ncbi:efflux RND transporter periplasmic adaptor subunit [Thalassomonas viridans]|uniref:Efflux RND transporter periplasmic adaptor subunit n=1 Tax=Thalassomonas viridans TaxID=137584 RepID=A0AAE9Z2U3_9GAMM|nr:efflux RND transporter periplasmic adaptor subunit [Thalassomonas viridans]WDE05030.1 efflux RND transporter periplasmic adaptor subunit [Thalassomonas viridans]
MNSDLLQNLAAKLLPVKVFFFLLLGSFVFPASAQNPPVTAQGYDAEEVQVEPYFDEIRRTGKLDFKRTLNLSFKSAGYLTRLTVDEGDIFKAQQLLAALETDELIEEKNASYAELLQAKRDVNRVKQLAEKKLSFEQELDNAETRVETTRARYKVAYYNLEKAQIVAPFDGVVLARHTELGELQSPGTQVLQVAALKNNWIAKVALTGEEVSRVRTGQAVSVILDRLGEVEGVITKVPAMANTQGQLFMIEILLPELSLTQGVAAGQIVEVVIKTSSYQAVYRLPIEALMAVDDSGKAQVMVNSAGQGQEVFIRQGFEILSLDNSYVYLLANEGDRPLNVVTRGWQHMNVSGR